MSLFSKLFGKSDDEMAESLNKLKKMMEDAGIDTKKDEKPKEEQPAKPAESSRPQEVIKEDGPSGFSWGPNMPEEENQYNSGLYYAAYFEKIFREEFSEYDVIKEDMPFHGSGKTFTFMKGGSKALVVEVKKDSSSAKYLRNKCEREGIPYTRFFYDHEGWWNTRAYVVDRVKKALG